MLAYIAVVTGWVDEFGPPILIAAVGGLIIGTVLSAIIYVIGNRLALAISQRGVPEGYRLVPRDAEVHHKRAVGGEQPAATGKVTIAEPVYVPEDEQPEAVESKDTITDKLGWFSMRGQLLLSQVRSEKKPAPTESVEDFYGEVGAYVGEHLGHPYVARLTSASGLPRAFTSLMDPEYRRLESGLDLTVTRLNEFIRERQQSGGPAEIGVETSPDELSGASPASPILASPELHFMDIEYEFAEPGRPGYPESKTGATRLLRAAVYVTCLSRMQVESVELEVQGKRIPSDWESTTVYGDATGRYIYLEIPPDVTPGLHEVQIVALANRKWWRSESSSVTFPPP